MHCRMLRSDIRGGDECTVVFQMDRIGHHQANMAINTRAAVPTRGRLARIVGADSNQIALRVAEVEMPSKFVAKADVSVGSLTKMEAVDPNIAVGHNAVKINKHTALGIFRGQNEMLAVPANASGQVSAGCSSGIRFVERTFNAPVVRNVQDTPLCVIQGDCFCANRIALEEAPIAIEGERGSHRLLMPGSWSSTR